MTIRLLVAMPAVGERREFADLTAEGFTLIYASSLPEAVQRVRTDAPHVILACVDAGSASLVCAVLRALGNVPLIVASPGLPSDVVRDCLNRGADSVLPMPMPAAELCAWVRAVIRRSAEQRAITPRHQIVLGDLVIDLYTRRVWRGETPIDLTRREFQLLAVLAEQPGRAVENRELLSRVWGPEYVNDVQNIRQYMGYLRAKLEEDPRQPTYILTVRGVGYRLAEPHGEAPPASARETRRRAVMPPCARTGQRLVRALAARRQTRLKVAEESAGYGTEQAVASASVSG